MTAAQVRAFAEMICTGVPMARDIIAEEDHRALADLSAVELLGELLLAHEDGDREDVAEYSGELFRRLGED